ncbi:hypothetical protein CIB84_008156 [Bambusicola thoracicus]|uniref:Uncharacterized protein n=1 Tax=Bambusicola thoracicus TaxID=9083 RepID=A0A2P4SVE4_BAMTH|nr:hypothetical protein CIB84_008156 [Bambusicola thoracicus]
MNEAKINHEEKEVKSKHGVTTNKLSSSPISAGTAEEHSSESDWTGLDNQDKGILLNGVFNEEESAKAFQEALIQWRNGNHDHRQEQRAESVGNHEVQTSLSVMKEHVQIQFKESGLSYMEKLLLKKYKRTSVDEMSAGCLKDSRPGHKLTALHKAVTEGEGKGDAGDTDDLTVEEVRRYWTSVFREEVPRSVTESAESTLKIEFLDDSYDMELEESCNFLVSEAEATEMNNQRNIEPFEEFGSGSAIADQKSTLPNLLPKETAAMLRKSSCHSTFMADTQYLLTSPPDENLVSSKEILQGPQEKLYSLPSEDVTSSSRCSRKMYGNVTDFNKTLDLKDHSRADMLGVCDEDQIDDEEEILEDKRQVIALQ